MFYTVQEMAATIKAWEYYVAIIFLLIMIAFWQVLARESKARRKAQPAGHASRLGSDYFVTREDLSLSSPGVQSQVSQTQTDCAPYTESALPCWFARQLVSKREDKACAGCQVFVQSVEHLEETARQERTASGPPK